MGHVDERDADLPLDGLELQLHLLAQLQVQRAERLVEEQHRRSIHERASQRHALPLAARELAGPPPVEALQADHAERLLHAGVALGAADLADHQAVADVVGHVHVREEGVVLEDRVDVALVRRPIGDVPAVKQHAAFRRQVEAGDHAQRRGLAGAGRPEQREELAARDRRGRRRRRRPRLRTACGRPPGGRRPVPRRVWNSAAGAGSLAPPVTRPAGRRARTRGDRHRPPHQRGSRGRTLRLPAPRLSSCPTSASARAQACRIRTDIRSRHRCPRVAPMQRQPAAAAPRLARPGLRDAGLLRGGPDAGADRRHALRGEAHHHAVGHPAGHARPALAR